MRSDAGLESNGAWSSSCVWVLDAPRTAPALPLQLRGRSFVILNAMQWPAGSARARSFLESFHEPMPASVLAGLLWDRVGAEATFNAGAVFCVLALIGLAKYRHPRERGDPL